MLFALLQRDLKARFEGRWLGAIWVMVEPMAHVAVLMLLLGYLRHRLVPGMPFELFLVTGLIPFLVFKALSLRVMAAIEGSRGLFGYRQVKPFDALLSRAMMETLMYGGVYVAFLFGLGWSGTQWLPDHPLELVGSGLVLMALGFGLGVSFAVLTDDLPQLRVFIRIAYMPLYFMSGVMFPLSTLPREVVPWFDWNPVMHLIELQRHYFVNSYRAIDVANIWYPATCALLISAFGMSLYRTRRLHLLGR